MTTTFLTGPAGTGKTTYAVQRLRQLLIDHVSANNILVMVPQQMLAQPYLDVLNDPTLPASAKVEVVTLSGLALQTLNLFWPLIGDRARFGRPTVPPIFLTIETAQYYLQQAIEPLLKQGYFDPNVVPITISLPRLMSQILDNLNKAALLGLPHTEVGQRLAASLPLEPSRRVAFEHTQACVDRFREFCLARNLLDYSLRIETFYQHLWPVPGIHEFLMGRYRHLIVDNIEEDTPFTHTVLQKWLPRTESALIVNDEDAGYHIFLGANWRTAHALAPLCHETIQMNDAHLPLADLFDLARRLGLVLGMKESSQENSEPNSDARRAITFQSEQFYPQMIDWVIQQIESLINEGTSPNEIVVLSPFVSDALRFSFLQRMEQRGLPARSHRPSCPLSEEPAAKTMLILARLAFPECGLLPEPFDVALALSQAIVGLDPVRASLLTQVVYRPHQAESGGVLSSFQQITGPIRERITYQAGEKFERLRTWLQQIRGEGEQTEPLVLDHFFSRLFGELLSQPGFGFHDQVGAGEVVANLVDSARKFRQVAVRVPLEISPQQANALSFPTMNDLNRDYLKMIEQGIFAAQYVRSWAMPSQEAVLIAPATTFLMSNRAVEYQFWLDAGSGGWWERIAQPLTHPYVLAADWEVGRPWTDTDEVTTQNDRLYRLLVGLVRRCHRHIFIINAEIGEQGYEQRGKLLMAFQQMLRQMQREQTT